MHNLHWVDTSSFWALMAKYRPFCRFGGKTAKTWAFKISNAYRRLFEQRLRQ